ncbi:programmed cell death 1 ligand 2 isoform X3 [Ovis canadensis]|uniref:programmed cell death 1 ligand 2 isoform X3 n=1 Tax=Ovis canadensis TaxID=37174 RepID=UPI0037500132
MMRLPQSDPVQNMFLLLILSLGLKLQQTEASYKKINTRYLKVSGTDEVELTCQAEGYPLAEVSWPNISIPTNTSHTKTSEGLYQVTSVLRLKPHPGRNFSCVFWNANVKELTSATIVQGPMEDPKIPPSSLLHVFIPSFIIALMFIATMVALRKRLCQKLYSGEDARKRSATMVRREVDRAAAMLFVCREKNTRKETQSGHKRLTLAYNKGSLDKGRHNPAQRPRPTSQDRN